jgi:cell wall-associated NlpC family hydrolase
MIARAEDLLATPFTICGRDPKKALDCCGLMFECHDAAGIDIRHIDRPEYSGTWWKTGQQQILLDGLRQVFDVTLTAMVPLGAEPGDWFLFAYDGRMVAHMALHVGGGDLIHTFHEERGMVRDVIRHRYWLDRFVGVARLKQEFLDG